MLPPTRWKKSGRHPWAQFWTWMWIYKALIFEIFFSFFCLTLARNLFYLSWRIRILCTINILASVLFSALKLQKLKRRYQSLLNFPPTLMIYCDASGLKFPAKSYMTQWLDLTSFSGTLFLNLLSCIIKNQKSPQY